MSSSRESPSFLPMNGQVPSMPPLPPGPGPSSQSVIPHVSQLLYREGDAWTAVLSLHSTVLQNVQQISASLSSENIFDSDSERELQYCSALSQAAAQCDLMHLELIKLRTLRKARSSCDLSALQPLINSHTRETVAVGSNMSSQLSMSIQSITSDLRTTIAEMKKTESEILAFHEILSTCDLKSFPTEFNVHVEASGSSRSLSLPDFVEIMSNRRTGQLFDIKSIVEDCQMLSLPVESSTAKVTEKKECEDSSQPHMPALIPVRRTGDKKR